MSGPAVDHPLVVLGPTASGKSAVGMAIAGRDRSVEIVAVDSMQVYRGMDIGTAKPTAADRHAVRHHCLDLVDPADEFTVADFVRAATGALADIHGRRATPVLVAGTGLYLRAITDPMDLPGQWPDLRAALEQRAVTEGATALHAELMVRDPDAAARIEPTNTRRVVRALEVTIGSGRRFSAFGPGLDHYPPVAYRMVGLRWARPALRRRIADRVEAMMRAGLRDEVVGLAAATLGRTARQALGYKELLEHLDGRCSLDAAVADIVRRTQQFAVRQERWFRRDPRIRWIDIHHDPVEETLAALATSPTP